MPQASATEETRRSLCDLPELWSGASLEERKRLLLTVLDAVYIDARGERSIVTLKPKPPLKPVFPVAVAKKGSGLILTNGHPDGSPEAPLSLGETGESRTLPETRPVA